MSGNIIPTRSYDSGLIDPGISCSNCQACCCRLEVMIISDTGVPDRHIAFDEWGGETMLRLADGWCSALDRETFMCTIYENRPWICREFEMGSYECREERTAVMGVQIS
ncbi:YkgJ family cysteine cluster protein [Marinobacter orientalis]|uniref:YkgJ family cysteine cluster protein n=1 Tax=Marinobacter orientalis TaxID=1928859 RepID=A0A7Y0WSS7_9GAMM|nr:YkgJ family cysteine cluster protein [Marinobacter orientalis]NMT64223.1 YkgJ family cysteine cluster protein [Marinobacter orientalis]TGX49446.1 YkgJ family cysteine cluster protein [Marinobacter orientalis]